MSFERCFKLSSFVLIGSGFFALASTGSVDTPSLALMAAAIVIAWFVDTGRLSRQVPRWLLNTLAIAYLPFYLFDYRWLSRSFVLATVHLIFYYAAVKMLTRSLDRDYVYLYLISFAELLAASTLTIDILFGVAITLFLLSGVSTLILFEMKRSNARALRDAAIRPVVVAATGARPGLELFSRFPAAAVLWISAGASAFILLLAIPLFLVLPRMALGVYRRPAGRTQMISGFSDRVELGQLGSIAESDAVVMRVRLNAPPERIPPNLRWRGIALDRYDGRSWSRSNLGRRPVIPREGFFKLEEYKQPDTELLWQTFFLEALSTDVVFASHKALAVSTELGSLQQDRAGALFTLAHTANKVRYTAASDPVRVDPSQIPSRPLRAPDEVRACCLQVPAEDPRVEGLAREVTAGTANPFEKALAVESHLRTAYAYSLDLRGRPNHPDPLAMFLFEERRGHCEYFATAMTVMLRQLGIPARLVNGFRMGEYNRLGDAWIVRQYDAHSWVEAWFYPYGWVEFDPTPAVPPRPKPTFLRAVGQMLDALGLWWSEEVINYDAWKQFRLVHSVRGSLLEAERRTIRFTRDLSARIFERLGSVRHVWPIRTSGPASVVVAPLILGAAVWVLYRRRGRWKRAVARAVRRVFVPESTSAIVGSFYGEALELLKDHGWTRNPDETGLEYARRLTPPSAATCFEALTRLYHRIRYGAASLPGDAESARSLLGSLRASLRGP